MLYFLKERFSYMTQIPNECEMNSLPQLFCLLGRMDCHCVRLYFVRIRPTPQSVKDGDDIQKLVFALHSMIVTLKGEIKRRKKRKRNCTNIQPQLFGLLELPYDTKASQVLLCCPMSLSYLTTAKYIPSQSDLIKVRLLFSAI